MTWDDDWEPDDDDLYAFMEQSTAFRPWNRGGHGKFIVTPEGELHSWATDPMGVPHHDSYAAENGINQTVKGDIAPNGAWWVSHDGVIDPRANPEEVMAQVEPQARRQGLQPIFQGYAAKVAVKSEICDRCLQPYAECTCGPSGDWTEEPVADPVRDLKSPTQSNFRRVIPESRWAWAPDLRTTKGRDSTSRPSTRRTRRTR